MAKHSALRPFYKKYTEGTWNIAKSVMGETAITSDKIHICTLPMLSHYSATGEEYNANARLISAAPELLGACINALDYIKSNMVEGRYSELLEEVIKKATGI